MEDDGFMRPAPRHGKDPVMSDSSSLALQVALAYYQAWTSKDVAAALGHLADDVVCDAPAGRIEGVQAYRQFLGPFAQMLISTELLAAFGDETKAVLVYDTRTPPVASGPGAECLTVRDGKIVYNRFIFDRLPFEAARRAAD
ncbi:MAG TPA: nuclear transport factor 2 family protein [Actinomycetota bacterium]|nr:nuclear transport factor 2 family protein [Actinomycetota bacterium]